DLRFRQTGLLRRVQPSRSLRIEILDYPGGWLLDLPLLELDYGQWGEQRRDWRELEPRRGLAGPLRDRVLADGPRAPLAGVLPRPGRPAAWPVAGDRAAGTAGCVPAAAAAPGLDGFSPAQPQRGGTVAQSARSLSAARIRHRSGDAAVRSAAGRQPAYRRRGGQ